jgi:hypothetical protein
VRSYQFSSMRCVMMEKHICGNNDSIKSEYPYIKDVNENVECMLCNEKFCIAHGGRSDVKKCFWNRFTNLINIRVNLGRPSQSKTYVLFLYDFLSAVFII